MPTGVYPHKCKPLLERFLLGIKVCDSGCWEWGKGSDYAKLKQNGHNIQAHRFSYEFFNNTVIPSELEIDHLCRNPKCVNPGHLEAVTHIENMLRGRIGLCQKEKIYCPKGHPYNFNNTYLNKGKRYCRICSMEKMRRIRSSERALTL